MPHNQPAGDEDGKDLEHHNREVNPIFVSDLLLTREADLL